MKEKILFIYWIIALPVIVNVIWGWRLAGWTLTTMLLTLIFEHILVKENL